MTLKFDCQLRYDDNFALRASFQNSRGVTALCGPSGSGKTTVLMLIAGLLRPDRGNITLDTTTFVDTDSGQWLAPQHRRIGMVFQESRLFPHRDVRSNLSYGMKRTRDPQLSFDRVVKVLELNNLLNRRPASLSGGEARRVAIGRALLRSPPLLLLDEPWTGLDEPLRDRIIDFLQRVLNEWHIPTLLVSHDRAVVAGLADDVIAIDQGVVQSRQHEQSTAQKISP